MKLHPLSTSLYPFGADKRTSSTKSDFYALGRTLAHLVSGMSCMRSANRQEYRKFNLARQSSTDRKILC